ncbi:MAG: hypothetical protein WCA47_00565 [Terriglobales bacterium]
MKIVRRSLHYRQKIDVPATHVDGNDSTGIKVSPVLFEGLPCKQVNRYRIAGECIDHQEVEPLILASRRFLFQQSPCISLYCVNPSIRVSEVSEYRVRPGGQINHGRIDFVISEIIAVPSVGGKRTRAQSDDSDAQASFSNAPFRVTLHYPPYPTPPPIVGGATRPMLSSAAQVVFIGETTRNFFGDVRFRKSPQTVFNGVDTGLYRTQAGGETKIALRRDYNLPVNSPAILFVGRFVEKKGLRVMRSMVELHPDWTWAFAGWGPLDPTSWNAANVPFSAP